MKNNYEWFITFSLAFLLALVFSFIFFSVIGAGASKQESIPKEETIQVKKITFLPALSKKTFSQYQEFLYNYYTPKKQPGVVCRNKVIYY